jgi:hypothetical protein
MIIKVGRLIVVDELYVCMSEVYIDLKAVLASSKYRLPHLK